MKRVVSYLILVACFRIPVSATVLHVPGEYATIQSGIDASVNGDTVLVGPGTYIENINMIGKAILLQSTSGTDSTFLQSQQDALPILKNYGLQPGELHIEGFTFRNTFSNRAIFISLNNGHQIFIKRNSFIGNISNRSDYAGGAVSISDCSVISIVENNFIGNKTTYHGGGLGLSNVSNTEIIRNYFYADTGSNDGSGGGALTISSCNGINIKRNIFCDNYAGAMGGALFVNGSSDINILNNTFDNNNCGNSIYGGGHVFFLNSNHCYVINSILTSGQYYAVFMDTETSYNIFIKYSDFFQNSPSDLYGITPSEGCIFQDPQYYNPINLNYNLISSSPCIDSGDPSSPLDPDSTRADMGALYFDQRYRILNYHLIAPKGDSIYLVSPMQFTWHSTTDIDSGYQVFYKLFIDNNPEFLSPDTSGVLSDTFYTLPDSLPRSQNYYWRVLAFNYHAAPIYSDETWQFYIDGYPTQPTIFAPTNGIAADSSTVFSWFASADPDSFDAISYTIQIDNDSTFASPEINQSGLQSGTVADDAFAIGLGELDDFDSLDIDTRYFWRVRADDNYGLSSDWTDGTNWFVFMAQNHPPSPPDSGFSPANGEEVISLTPVITWNIADDPDPDDFGDNLSYAIRLSQDSLFTGFVYNDTTGIGINQIQPTSELTDNSHYFYQVKTIDDGGLSSDWSARQDFWTNHYNFPPEPFLVYGPEDGENQVVYYTQFSWGNTVDYDPNSSFTYSIEVSDDSLFRWITWSHHGLTDTALAVETDSLRESGRIFWRVKAVDDDSLVRIGGIPEGAKSIVILPPGDANSSGVTNGLDVTFLVSYFKGLGPAPNPLLAGDANGNCQTNGLDVTYLVSYLKGIGPAPIRPDCDEIILSTDGGINETH